MTEPQPSPEGRYPAGREALGMVLLDARRRNLQPPPAMTLSQWAQRYAVLSRETSATTGRFTAYPYQIGMMDAVTDPTVSMITVMKSARVGYTKVLDHAVGYFIHQDPSPMLVVQPTVEDAEGYSSTEIEPMLRDTPVLSEIAGDLRARDAKQKLQQRTFKNGASIHFVGANSPRGFRRITVRFVAFDEVDGYPITGAGKEGDQIKLGIRRSQTFWNRKVMLGSTPTVKGESRIEKSLLTSDQRRYYVPCPQCGEMQVLDWGGADVPHGIKWDRDESGKGLPETAHYVCVNGCPIDEVEKEGMLAAGEWRATAPFTGHAGFHIWTGYSLDPNATWAALVAEWLEVKSDPVQRQTFINTVLGEPYEDAGDMALSEIKLVRRYAGVAWGELLPDGVAVITIGVDTQGDRLELEIVGWGRNEESWSLGYQVLDGDPGQPEVWKQLDAILRKIWRKADGTAFEVMAACVDSGGHNTQAVYDFCKARLARRVWAIKGESAVAGGRSPIWPTKRPSARTKKSFRPVILGVNAGKDAIRKRLHIEQPGPGYMHYPGDRDLGYFTQLISERTERRYQAGHPYRVWVLPPGRANEALDCRNYALGALKGLEQQGLSLNRRADEVGAAITPWLRVVADAPDLEPSPSPAPTAAPSGAPARPPGPRVTVEKKPGPRRRLA